MILLILKIGVSLAAAIIMGIIAYKVIDKNWK